MDVYHSSCTVVQYYWIWLGEENNRWKTISTTGTTWFMLTSLKWSALLLDVLSLCVFESIVIMLDGRWWRWWPMTREKWEKKLRNWLSFLFSVCCFTQVMPSNESKTLKTASMIGVEMKLNLSAQWECVICCLLEMTTFCASVCFIDCHNTRWSAQCVWKCCLKLFLRAVKLNYTSK